MLKTVLEIGQKYGVPEQGEAEPSAALLTPELRVHMLGSPSVEWAGYSLVIPRRQVRAVLYRLATRLTPLPREHLCGLFWPDTPECTARRNLSHLLTHLHCLLPAPEILLCPDDHVALDPQRAWSDTVALDQLCLTLGVSPPRLKALEQAVTLYRGSFLTGFSLPTSPEFELWADLERSAWECRYLEMLATLVEAQAAQGNYHAAIEYAQRYLAIDDLVEEMHCRLITLYAAIGDRGAALHQFEHCTIVLERELGVSPLPETWAAYQVALGRRPISRPSLTLLSSTWTTLPSLDTPLIGREAALCSMQQAYARVRSGQGRMILISGEPGIGKSRLMQEFAINLAGEATVITGSGHEDERGLPYWLLVEALGPYLPTLDPTLPSSEPLYLTPLAGLWPGLHKFLPNQPVPIPLELGQERTLLLQALDRLLLSLVTQRPPLILCLDDLQWADEGTLAWLSYLARQLKNVPVLVLGTYRTDEAAAVSNLRTELARLDLRQEIRLEGLSELEVLSLVRRLSGHRSGAERFSRRLHRETGGNPFFLLETLRVLFETGLLWEDETGWSTGVDETTRDYRELPLPETLDMAIQARLSHLPAATRQVLEAGAVLGHRFSFELVQATSARHPSEVVEALDELLTRQLIIEQEDWYRFKHDLIQTAVYRQLSYGRRRLLHRRAGETLEKLQLDDAAGLARHFERAEERGRAARYALQAGLAAKAVFAYAEARTHFDRALALLKQEATHLRDEEALLTNQHLQVQALAERGWVFRLLGDMAAYTHDSAEVAQLAERLGDQRSLAHLCWREAYTHRWFCRYAEARASAEEGLRLSRTAGDLLLEALCLREVGLAARETGDYPQARASLERALQHFMDLDERVYEIHTLGNLSTLHWRIGEFEPAINLARPALTRCEAGQLPFERRIPLGDIGAVAVSTGDLDLARQCLLESLAIARQIADRTQEIFCLGHLGRLCLKLKQPAEALEFLHTALDLAQSIDSRTEQSWLWAGLAEAHRLDGNPALAAEHAQQALKLAQANERAYDQALAQRILAELGQADS